VSARAEPARLRVRVQSRAGRDELVVAPGGVVLVRVKAPPEGGRANAAVCAVVARRLGVGRTRVALERGVRSREKLLTVDGITSAELRARLGT
jgi:uncharacterized protein YggU (UPF0235/DUF167 family)